MNAVGWSCFCTYQSASCRSLGITTPRLASETETMKITTNIEGTYRQFVLSVVCFVPWWSFKSPKDRVGCGTPSKWPKSMACKYGTTVNPTTTYQLDHHHLQTMNFGHLEGGSNLMQIWNLGDFSWILPFIPLFQDVSSAGILHDPSNTSWRPVMK